VVVGGRGILKEVEYIHEVEDIIKKKVPKPVPRI
jgi:hypothetical protein